MRFQAKVTKKAEMFFTKIKEKSTTAEHFYYTSMIHILFLSIKLYKKLFFQVINPYFFIFILLMRFITCKFYIKLRVKFLHWYLSHFFVLSLTRFFILLTA